MAGQPQLMIVDDESTQDSSQDPVDCSDTLLLDAWRRHRDADAFAALVRRYSGLVLGVCRRQSRCREDAEDAFQATFLILSRSAHRLRRTDRLAGWLHQVAYRTACRGRARSGKTMDSLIEEPVDQQHSLNEIAQRHRLRALDEELDRLPEHYRHAIVLHYFEGCTYDQTAERMNSTEPSVRGCLQRAKQRLHRRLIGRGVSLSLAFAALSVTGSREAAASELVNRTVQLAGESAGGAALDPHLHSLLAKESSIVFSPAVLSTACIAALSFAGLLIAQVGGPQARRAAPSVTLGAANDSADQQTEFQVERSAAAAEFGDAGGGEMMEEDMMEMMDMEMDMMGGMMGMGMGSAPARSSGQTPANSWSTSNPQAYAKIEAALAKTTQLQYKDVPLDQVVSQLQTEHNMPIVIELRALEDIGLAPDLPVNFALGNVSLESALNMMLDDFDLTFTIDHEVLFITTEEADEANHQLLRIYWSGKSGLQADEGSAELIQTMVDPDSWTTVGGQGEISILGGGENKPSGLAVRATYQTHRKIEHFLKSVETGSSGAVSGVQKSVPGMSGMGGAMMGGSGAMIGGGDMMSGSMGMMSGAMVGSGSNRGAGSGGMMGTASGKSNRGAAAGPAGTIGTSRAGGRSSRNPSPNRRP